MNFIVYIPQEKTIIACEKEDFFSETICGVQSLNNLTGSSVLGACMFKEEVYTKCYLLQVVSDDLVTHTLKFLHRLFFEKTESEEKRASLATFNLLQVNKQRQACTEVTISNEEIHLYPIVETKPEPREEGDEADFPPPSKRARTSLPLALMSPANGQDGGPSEATRTRSDTSGTGEDSESASVTLLGGNQPEPVDKHVFKDEATAQLLHKVHDQLKELSEKLSRLEQSSFASQPVKLKLPVFVEAEDFLQKKNLSPWMMQQGGANVKDFVNRCLNLLIAPKLQRRVNRSGKRGRAKFPYHLEEQLKDSAIRLFPNCTAKDTEQAIVRFLHNSADRQGQREKRISQQKMESGRLSLI